MTEEVREFLSHLKTTSNMAKKLGITRQAARYLRKVGKYETINIDGQIFIIDK